LAHVRVLLKADQGLSDLAVAEAVEVSRPTVEPVRRRFAEEGTKVALDPYRPEKPRPRKADGHLEAHLIVMACSEPAKGARPGRCPCSPPRRSRRELALYHG